MGRTYGGGGAIMKNLNISAVRVMKYVILAAIVVFIAVLIIYVSGSSRSFDEVKADVEASLDMSELNEQDSAAFKRTFGLNAADYTGVAYYSAESTISASEVLLVRIKNDGQIREITDAIEERIDSRRNDFENYLPEQVKLIDNARQSVRGAYVFYAVSPDADTYLKAFNSSL